MIGQAGTFPDVEDLLRVYLEGVLAAATVSLHQPVDDPAAGHVQLWRTGGVRTRLVDAAVLKSDVWHQREAEAARLCGDVVDLCVALGGNTLDGWQITGVQNVGGVASDPDPRWSDRYRYTAMIEVRVRGARRPEEGAP